MPYHENHFCDLCRTPAYQEDVVLGFLTVLLIIDAIVLIVLVVALQHGNESGLGSAFGTGNSAGFFGASGGVSFIVRATWIAGALLFGLSLAVAWLRTEEKFRVGSLLTEVTAPVTPIPSTTPVATATPASSQN